MALRSVYIEWAGQKAVKAHNVLKTSVDNEEVHTAAIAKIIPMPKSRFESDV